MYRIPDGLLYLKIYVGHLYSLGQTYLENFKAIRVHHILDMPDCVGWKKENIKSWVMALRRRLTAKDRGNQG